MEKILLFWSGGKDSALTLYYLKNNPQYEVVGLITTMNRDKNRVSFHGIPDSLICEQAKLLKLPLQRIFLSNNPSNEEYTEHVGKILSLFAKKGIVTVAFGDIFLDDVKKFKETFINSLGMKAIFPLWGKKSEDIAREFFSTNHKALVTAVDETKLDPSFLACEYNEDYLNRLPKNIDPTGENGEFHTFVTYGPFFKMRVPFSKSVAEKEGPYLVSLIKEP